MTQTQEQAVSLLTNFFQQLKKEKDTAQIEAQKLINLFRQLDVIGAEYLPTFNEQLLNAPDEVQLNLTGLMGGTAVRSYLDFLKGKQGEKENSSEDDVSSSAHSYLPSPEEVSAVSFGPSAVPGAPVDSDTLAQLQQYQKNMTETLQNVTKEQITLLNESLKQILQKMTDISERQIQEMKNLSGRPDQKVYEIEEYPQPVGNASVYNRPAPSFGQSTGSNQTQSPKEAPPVHQIEITETT